MKKIFKILGVVSIIAITCTSCGHEVETKKNLETSAVTPIVIPDESSSNDSDVTSAATTTTATKKEKKKATTTKKAKEEEYIVYKPSTHYIHKSTCSWVNDECYKIDSTEGLQVRVCEDCNPEIEVVEYYEEPVVTYAAPQVDNNVEEVEVTTTLATTTKKIETTTSAATTTSATTTTEVAEEVVENNNSIDSYSRQLLAEIVWHEAGCNWIGQYDKARIAAGVMNRVNDSRFPDTVYSVLTAPGQFTGYWPGCCTPTDECYAAVDYYFAHTNEFGNENSWFGNGVTNTFYYQ